VPAARLARVDRVMGIDAVLTSSEEDVGEEDEDEDDEDDEEEDMQE
jgi:hypothetical protein